ncbi:TPM domain-containing protein [Flavobacterium sp.]|uniref:TPM domain-containing protein n=1 Tax=Flavobacterium sp. TaxID=239 RepID=UPI002637013B|nr:TPM domain-containing protein [Flavobacterium sp.]
MSAVESFLTSAEESAIVAAIASAERATSGEIRLHIERLCSGDPLERAKQVFELLEMHKTEQKNGVLFYLAVDDHKFAICGDRGIDAVVPADFWNSTKDLLASHFKRAEFAAGLIAGIELAGEQLKKYFPYAKDDQNELSNEISKG